MTEGGDAGHFIPAGVGGLDLLFDPINVNLECSRCNAWSEDHYLGYEKGLNHRYGPGTADMLKERYFAYKNGGIKKEWPDYVYVKKLAELGVTPNFSTV